jgi:hypothetical protein
MPEHGDMFSSPLLHVAQNWSWRVPVIALLPLLALPVMNAMRLGDASISFGPQVVQVPTMLTAVLIILPLTVCYRQC